MTWKFNTIGTDQAERNAPEGVFVDLDAMKSEAPEVTHTVL